MDVALWLRELGLGQYARVFTDNEIDAAVLDRLTAEDLKDMGITIVGHRRKLLDAIEALRGSTRVSSTDEAATGAAGARAAVPADAPGQAERRQLTVMFVDLVDSTALSARLDPEEMGEILATYQNVVAREITRYGGAVAKFMGDGVLAYFGWPQAHEDDAERAVRAGLDLARAVAGMPAEDGTSLAVRVGIATGLVMVGMTIGQGTAQEQAVVGDAPNLAARLQSLAQPGTVVVGASTRLLLGDLFDLHDLGPLALKGFDEPVAAWSVIGASRVESRFDALRVAALTPFVGRSHELAILQERWSWVHAGEGQVVLVAGDAGIGKSRLLRELRQTLDGEAVTTLRYYGSTYHTNSAFHPILEQLRRAAGFAPEDDPATSLTKLEALLAHGSNQLAEGVPLIGSLLSIPTGERYPPRETSAAQRKQHTMAALVDQLEDLARAGPVLLLFEDAHWFDPSTLELLDLVVDRVRRLRVLMLVTYRPEFVPGWNGQSHVTQLPLNRLGRTQVAALVGEVTGGRALPSAVLEGIVVKTDGVPLFAEELTKTMLASDWLVDTGGRYEVARPLPSFAIPETLSDSLMARLDRLGPVKEVAQIASVIGREFDQATLAAVSPESGQFLLTALDQLVAAGLVFRHGASPEISYSFKHALVRDAAYASLLRENRKRLHRRVAEVLAGPQDADPALLAHHWEQAGDPERALPQLMRAGDDAASRFAIWEAVAHYWHAAALLEALPESAERRSAHLQIVLSMIETATASSEAGDFWHDDTERDAAFRHVDKALATAEARADRASLARLEAFKGKNQHDEALLGRAAGHARAIGDQRLEADIVRQHAGFCGHMGRFQESEALVDRAIELLESLGSEVELGFAMASYGRCYRARAGKLQEALSLAERARMIADRVGDLKLRSWLAMESEPCMYKGAWDDTVVVARTYLPIAWGVGNWAVVLWSSAFATIAELRLGRLQAAEELIVRAVEEAAPPAGDDFPKIYAQIAMAQLRLAQGATDLALEAAELAMRHTERSMLPQLELGAAHRTCGEVLLAMGRLDEAERHIGQSLAILGAIQSRPELGQSLMAYGRVRSTTDPPLGQDYLRRAMTLFTEIGASGWVSEAEDALAHLADGPLQRSASPDPQI
ncbi:MAG: adenylate/guanylate cyclase domain-containing protein [Geminicoccaceae bacterium]